MWSSRSYPGEQDGQYLRLRREALGPADSGRPPPIDLSLSNPTQVGLSLPPLGACLGPHLDLPYVADSRGLRSAREALARAYTARLRQHGRAPLDAGAIQLTSSTSEAYLLLFRLLCDAGDCILVPQPSYPLFQQLAETSGVELLSYQLRFAGDWVLDPASLPSAQVLAEKRIRAILAVSPNNPTGSLLGADSWARLVDLGLPLIVDEVFRPYRFGGGAASDEQSDAFLDASVPLYVLDGLSKRAVAPGLKLGWIAQLGQDAALCDEAAQRLSHMADATLSVGAAVQAALPEILEREVSRQQVVLRRLRRSLELLKSLTAGSALDVLQVDGGWSAIVRFPAIKDEQSWWRESCRQAVWAQPGATYNLPLGPAFVVSLLTPEETMREGLTRWLRLVADELESPES